MILPLRLFVPTLELHKFLLPLLNYLLIFVDCFDCALKLCLDEHNWIGILCRMLFQFLFQNNILAFVELSIQLCHAILPFLFLRFNQLFQIASLSRNSFLESREFGIEFFELFIGLNRSWVTLVVIPAWPSSFNLCLRWQYADFQILISSLLAVQVSLEMRFQISRNWMPSSWVSSLFLPDMLLSQNLSLILAQLLNFSLLLFEHSSMSYFLFYLSMASIFATYFSIISFLSKSNLSTSIIQSILELSLINTYYDQERNRILYIISIETAHQRFCRQLQLSIQAQGSPNCPRSILYLLAPMKADSSEEDPKEREQLPRSEQQIPSKQSFWNILFPFGRTEQKQLWREDEPLQKQEQIKRQIQEKYLIIDQDHSQRQFSSDTESEGVQKQEQEQESEEVVMLKAKVESLTLALEKCEVQKKLLQIDNKRMREEIQHWLNDPRQVRKYARIQGELSFEFECDEVKMEKRSYLEPKQED